MELNTISFKTTWERSNIESLVGNTIKHITQDTDSLIFHCSDGSNYSLYHEQDCCENVYIEDICGDLDDLLNSPILLAEEVSNEAMHWPTQINEYTSETWTFYKISTIKGGVTIRWYGKSNGYYSETADFFKEVSTNINF